MNLQLLLPNWLAGASALAAVALLCAIRIPNEEAMMCEFFGQEYRDYMKRTGSVIPRPGTAHEAWSSIGRTFQGRCACHFHGSCLVM
jgi:hypothetical protein